MDTTSFGTLEADDEETKEYHKKTKIPVKRFGIKIEYDCFDITAVLESIRKKL